MGHPETDGSRFQQADVSLVTTALSSKVDVARAVKNQQVLVGRCHVLMRQTTIGGADVARADAIIPAAGELQAGQPDIGKAQS
jgi:hypothetical protein